MKKLEFEKKLFNIRRRLREKEIDHNQLNKEEKRQIREVEKRFEKKRHLIWEEKREIKRELSLLQEECPNFSEHTKAVHENHRSGQGFVCRICGYEVHESDERL